MANLQDIVNRSEVGAIKPWGKATAPAGYVLCDGAAISRTDYADLFAVISTTYGAGNGSTTFNVPDLQGKMPQGYESGNYAMAGTGGANTVTVSVTNNQSVTVTGSIDNTSITEAQMPSHHHEMKFGHPSHGGPGSWRPSTGESTQTESVNTGSGTGHNHSHTLSGTLSGTVAVATNLGGAVTASGTNSFSPYVVVNYIIKH